MVMLKIVLTIYALFIRMEPFARKTIVGNRKKLARLLHECEIYSCHLIEINLLLENKLRNEFLSVLGQSHQKINKI